MDSLSDQLGQDRGWFRRLDEFLQPFDSEYDWIIIDSPPELNRLSDSAIIAAQNTVVPVEPAEPSLHGLQKMLEDQFIPIRNDLDDSVEIIAIVLNRVLDDNETTRVRQDLKENFSDELAPVEIRKRVASESESLFHVLGEIVRLCLSTTQNRICVMSTVD